MAKKGIMRLIFANIISHKRAVLSGVADKTALYS